MYVTRFVYPLRGMDLRELKRWMDNTEKIDIGAEERHSRSYPGFWVGRSGWRAVFPQTREVERAR